MSRRSPDIQTSPEVDCSKPARIRSSVVLPEPLSPRMVRNSPSAISSEMSRSTMFLPKCLATERMESSGADAWLTIFASDSRFRRRCHGYRFGATCISRARSARATQASTALLLLRSRSRCTWRGAEHSARNRADAGNCPRRRGAGFSLLPASCTAPPVDSLACSRSLR